MTLDKEPMGEETTSLGGIHISPGAVATIAYHATLNLWVGWRKNIADDIVKTSRTNHRGVTVDCNGEEIDIEINIIVEYGTHQFGGG
jgi:uncharacterized alkaline shock family protein YloU